MATTVTSDKPHDLNTISYDAPYSFPEPSFVWTRNQSRKGANWTTQSVPDIDLSGKWVIVTGGNNGIGREASLRFAGMGANLVLACRQPPPHEQHPNDVVEECKAKAKAAGHVDNTIEWWEIDMADLATVKAFAKKWLATSRPIDILCNNAGVGSSPGGSSVFKTKDGFEFIHQVNFLSHVLLTLSILPAIAKAAEPRIICTTSCFHFHGTFDLTNFNGEKGGFGAEGVKFYQNNKLWYQTWLTELQHRFLKNPKYRHITINGVHPGYVASGIWNLNSGSSWKTIFLQSLAWCLAINPQQGSLCILNAATSENGGPDPEKQGVGKVGGKGGGRYFNRIWEDEPMPYTRDPDCRMRVWRKVNDELKLEQAGLLKELGLKAIQ